MQKRKRTLKKILKEASLLTSRIITSNYDKEFLNQDVPLSRINSPENYENYIFHNANKEGYRVLEIGSREVTGKSEARKKFTKANYVGFDYYEGNNVDIVGDVHKLSSYFNQDEKFDFIYSIACFEHFSMPWIAAQEIIKMLKVGGTLLIRTHFSFCAHERPWKFFQFSDMGLKVLFSQEMGMKCIEAGMSNPIVGRYSMLAHSSVRGNYINGLYSGSDYIGIKEFETNNFNWETLHLKNIVNNTVYPLPQK